MCAAKRLVLAVDCGSTNLKGALFDATCNRLLERSVPVDYSRDGDGIVEFEAAMITKGLRSLIEGLCADAGVEPLKVTDLAFDSQAQTFAMCDRNGEALTPFYSWLDRRAEQEARDIGNVLGERFHQHCSLAPPIAQLQLCKMLWLKRHCPDAVKPDTQLAMLPGFLACCLGAENVTDRNLAAMGGAYSLRQGGWWEEALQLCAMGDAQMPRLVDVGGSVKIRRENSPVVLRPGTRVVFAGNDQTAGAFGNGCESGGMVITLGTALVVYRFAGAKAGPYHSGTFWGPYPGGAFYELSTIDEGCYALDWARRRLLPDASAATFDGLAQTVIDENRESAAPLFCPRHIRAGKPWHGAADSDLPAMAYSVLEGIAFSLRELTEIMLDAGGQAKLLSVTGGGSKSKVWMQLIANVLKCPLRQGQGDPLLGAACMALDKQLNGERERKATVWPDPSQEDKLDTRYRTWLASA